MGRTKKRIHSLKNKKKQSSKNKAASSTILSGTISIVTYEYVICVMGKDLGHKNNYIRQIKMSHKFMYLLSFSYKQVILYIKRINNSVVISNQPITLYFGGHGLEPINLSPFRKIKRKLCILKQNLGLYNKVRNYGIPIGLILYTRRNTYLTKKILGFQYRQVTTFVGKYTFLKTYYLNV